MTRRGFTLTEMLVATVVMAVLGVALLQMLIGNTRFASRQEAMVGARRTARTALNVLAAELHMVGAGGVLAASTDSLRVRIPYAFGVICRSSGPRTYASLLPPDSLAYAIAQDPGLAWRTASGSYAFVGGVTVANASGSSVCAPDSIRVVPGGRAIELRPVMPSPVGAVFYLFETVTYRFTASALVPGRVGLWRTTGSAPAEELAVPFDASAGFRCLTGPSLLPEDCPPPGGVAVIRGIELRSIGASEFTPQGASVPQRFDLVTRVHFMNGLN